MIDCHCFAGTRNTIVLAVMANRPKEDSETDPLEDEIEFCRTMRAAGFLVQIPWQMPLTQPGEELLDLRNVHVLQDVLFQMRCSRCVCVIGSVSESEVLPLFAMGLPCPWPIDVLV